LLDMLFYFKRIAELNLSINYRFNKDLNTRNID